VDRFDAVDVVSGHGIHPLAIHRADCFFLGLLIDRHAWGAGGQCE
jgi:hypothetical protein